MNNINNSKPKEKRNKLITDFFKPYVKEVIPIKCGYNQDTNHNHCLECGIDMGYSNRQLCGKWRCYG